MFQVDWLRLDFGVLVGYAVRDDGINEQTAHVFARADVVEHLGCQLDAIVVVADHKSLGDVGDAELGAQFLAPQVLEHLDAGEPVVRHVGHEHYRVRGEEGVLVNEAEPRVGVDDDVVVPAEELAVVLQVVAEQPDPLAFCREFEFRFEQQDRGRHHVQVRQVAQRGADHRVLRRRALVREDVGKGGHVRVGNVDPQPLGGVSLGIGVHDKHLIALCEAAGDVVDDHGLSSPALHGSHRDDPCGVLLGRRRLGLCHSLPP